MSEHTPPQTAEPYVEWVEYTLLAAANALPDRPDGFLWNARRCAEAVSMACLQGRAKAPKPGADQEVRFHDLISQLELLGYPKDIVRALRRVMLCGNAGIHVQVEGWPAVQKKARECAPMLIETVRWFYGQHLKQSEPVDVQQALSSLEDFHAGRVEATPSERPPKELVADSWAPRASSKPPPSSRWRLVAAGLAGAVVAAGAMRALTPAPASAPVEGETHTVTVVAPPPAPPPPMHAAAPSAAPVVAPSAAPVVAPSATPEVVPVDASVVEGVVASVDAAVAVDVAAPPASPATSVVSCPEGALAFQGERITVGQPSPRPLWPVARGSVRPVDVGTFCLDAQPVRASEYQRCVAAGQCPAPGTRPATGCFAPPAGNAVMTCVTWPEADAYCRWRGQRVPTMAQWEWSGRHVGRRAPTIVGGLYEWVRDPFPAEHLNRGPAAMCGDAACAHMTRRQPQFDAPATAALYSWNQSRAAERRADLGFRCVTD